MLAFDLPSSAGAERFSTVRQTAFTQLSLESREQRLQMGLLVEIERNSFVRSFDPNSYRFLDESAASGRMALASPCIRRPSSPYAQCAGTFSENRQFVA
jgi:hypothetical protein